MPKGNIPVGQHASRSLLRQVADCECVFDCSDNPATKCSLSGKCFHVHPGAICPVHPAAPGDH